MKTAVIYTGQIRTFEKTLRFLKKNLLLHSNVHIFAVLESEDISKHQILIKQGLGDHLKSLIWLNKHDRIWSMIREGLLHILNVEDWVKQYLRNGGSMIEYYQMYLSYGEMCKYEKSHNIKYEYIVRCRTDTIFNKPIDFSWINLSIDQIKERYELIAKKYENKIQQLVYFMSTIINKDLINNLNDQVDIYEDREVPIESYYLNHNDESLTQYLECLNNENSNFEDRTFKNLKNYIKHGKYILTVRKNLLYIVKREFFTPLTNLYCTYGRHNVSGGSCWWNAESQFRSICVENGLSIFNYDTMYEGRSIESYKTEYYFKDDNGKEGELINDNILYLLVRH